MCVAMVERSPQRWIYRRIDATPRDPQAFASPGRAAYRPMSFLHQSSFTWGTINSKIGSNSTVNESDRKDKPRSGPSTGNIAVIRFRNLTKANLATIESVGCSSAVGHE